MDDLPREERIRVVHVTLGLEMGGQEKLLVEFARHADRERFEVRFVSLGARGALADDIEACGWPVDALEVPTKFRPRLILRLARLFRAWGTQVVHTHEDRPLIHAAPAARLGGVRTVVHTRHGQSISLTRRQRLLVRLGARLVDRFVCVSGDAAQRALDEGVPASRLTRIWNGIDLHHFRYSGPAAHGPALSVGRLSPEKDFATLLRATALVAREDPQFRLELGGGGPCLRELQCLAEELGIAGHVRFLGPINDVNALLRRGRLFVLSSISEGVALTLLEAMAKGLPVVATRVGGTPEVVRDGETGLLVPPSDPAALAEAMLTLYRDPEEARALGLAGRDRVEEHFDIRHMVSQYELLYSARTAALPTAASAR